MVEIPRIPALVYPSPSQFGTVWRHRAQFRLNFSHGIVLLLFGSFWPCLRFHSFFFFLKPFFSVLVNSDAVACGRGLFVSVDVFS